MKIINKREALSTKNKQAKNNGFADRLKNLITAGNYTKVQVARAIGVSGTAIDSYLNGREPNSGTLLKLAHFFKQTMEWFLTGSDKGIRLDITEDGTFVYVPQLAVTAEAGEGFTNDTEEVVEHLAFRSEWVRDQLRIKPDNLVSIRASGDSMEPTINNGDELLVDISKREISEDGIYCLKLSVGDLVVKRVQRRPDGELIIVSDNQRYQPFTMTPGRSEAISVAGKVVWIGRKL